MGNIIYAQGKFNKEQKKQSTKDKIQKIAKFIFKKDPTLSRRQRNLRGKARVTIFAVASALGIGIGGVATLVSDVSRSEIVQETLTKESTLADAKDTLLAIVFEDSTLKENSKVNCKINQEKTSKLSITYLQGLETISRYTCTVGKDFSSNAPKEIKRLTKMMCEITSTDSPSEKQLLDLKNAIENVELANLKFYHSEIITAKEAEKIQKTKEKDTFKTTTSLLSHDTPNEVER